MAVIDEQFQRSGISPAGERVPLRMFFDNLDYLLTVPCEVRMDYVTKSELTGKFATKWYTIGDEARFILDGDTFGDDLVTKHCDFFLTDGELTLSGMITRRFDNDYRKRNENDPWFLEISEIVGSRVELSDSSHQRLAV